MGEQRQPEVRDGNCPPPPSCPSLQHSSTPRARLPALLPTLMHRPMEGLTQPLALRGRISSLKRHSMSESAVQCLAASSLPQRQRGPCSSPPLSGDCSLSESGCEKGALTAPLTWKAHSVGTFLSCSEHSPAECILETKHRYI